MIDVLQITADPGFNLFFSLWVYFTGTIAAGFAALSLFRL